MRTYLVQATLIAATVATRHLMGINVPHDQKDLGVLQAPNCHWSGTSPFCAGACDRGYEDCGTSSCGDGACCWTGYKKYCCRTGCPSSLPIEAKSRRIGAHPEDDDHKGNGPHDDICGPDEAIYCSPEAKSNDDCICVKV